MPILHDFCTHQAQQIPYRLHIALKENVRENIASKSYEKLKIFFRKKRPETFLDSKNELKRPKITISNPYDTHSEKSTSSKSCTNSRFSVGCLVFFHIACFKCTSNRDFRLFFTKGLPHVRVYVAWKRSEVRWKCLILKFSKKKFSKFLQLFLCEIFP